MFWEQDRIGQVSVTLHLVLLLLQVSFRTTCIQVVFFPEIMGKVLSGVTVMHALYLYSYCTQALETVTFFYGCFGFEPRVSD